MTKAHGELQTADGEADVSAKTTAYEFAQREYVAAKEARDNALLASEPYGKFARNRLAQRLKGAKLQHDKAVRAVRAAITQHTKLMLSPTATAAKVTAAKDRVTATEATEAVASKELDACTKALNDFEAEKMAAPPTRSASIVALLMNGATGSGGDQVPQQNSLL